MDPQPRLLPVRVPTRPEGAVLVLHGGGARADSAAVSRTQLSVLRMVPIARRIARRSRRLAVYRLLNSRRGWEAGHPPVEDVRWALDRLGERHRDRRGTGLPTVLVGHSLGGRAALLAATAPQVVGAVALAAYLRPGDGRTDLSGRRILFVHGTRDRVAGLAQATTTARELAASAEVGFIRILGGTHSMLRHQHLFDGFAADWVDALLAGARPGGPVGRILAGERALEV